MKSILSYLSDIKNTILNIKVNPTNVTNINTSGTGSSGVGTTKYYGEGFVEGSVYWVNDTYYADSYRVYVYIDDSSPIVLYRTKQNGGSDQSSSESIPFRYYFSKSIQFTLYSDSSSTYTYLSAVIHSYKPLTT